MASKEFRCTRIQPYLNPDCFGYKDLDARQGYYIKSESEPDAIAQMAQLFPDDDAGFTASVWRIIPMNTIKIEFTHEVERPKFTFGDRVAVAGNCSPNLWPTGKVTGLLLDEAIIPMWFYVVKIDWPTGFTEEYPAIDLVPESSILTLQAEWDLDQTAQIQTHQDPDEECDHCDGKGWLVDDRTFQSYSCSTCAATGIKDYAKRLPPASLKQEF